MSEPSTTDSKRRDFLKMTGLGLLAFNINGVTQLLTPRDARAQGASFSVLTGQEVKTLEALGDTLLPGAAEDGIANFVDHQLAVKPEDTLLTIRYLDFPPPYTVFYQAGLGNLDGYAHEKHGKGFAALTAEQRNAIVGEISRETPKSWQGPPSQLFYFAVRSDAVDVVYGTVEGFKKLNIPYMAHIMPPSKW